MKSIESIKLVKLFNIYIYNNRQLNKNKQVNN